MKILKTGKIKKLLIKLTKGIKHSMNSKGCIILFLTPFLLVGIGLIVISIYYSNLAFQSKSWTPIEATVKTIEVNSIKKSGKNGNYNKEKTIILYEYSIDKKGYKGDEICVGYNLNTVEDYSSIYDKINNADKIKVFVNPNNFSQSVMVTGLTNNILIIILFTLFWNLFLIAAYKKKPNDNSFSPILSVALILALISMLCIFAVAKGNININDIVENIVVLNHK